jgi:hypothetical protein
MNKNCPALREWKKALKMTQIFHIIGVTQQMLQQPNKVTYSKVLNIDVDIMLKKLTPYKFSADK